LGSIVTSMVFLDEATELNADASTTT